MYLYDSMTPGYLVEGHADHRDLMASLVQRSRYFLADRAKANEPNFSSESHVFGPRFFEGAAAGAVLVGEEPKSTEFLEHFDWPGAVFSFPHGGDHIGELIAELDAQPERMETIRRENVVNVLRRHDSAYRWGEILETLGLQPRPAMKVRTQGLADIATEIEAA